MGKHIIALDFKDIEYLKGRYDDANKALKRMTDEICKRLADMGAVKASLEFSRAIYTGEEDHEISVEARDGGYAVIASGATVLFVEFGSGLIGYGHPEVNGYGPGTYPGKGHWNDPNGWWIPREKNGGHSQHTYGNPANMPMYNTIKDLEGEIERMVKDTFDLAWHYD